MPLIFLLLVVARQKQSIRYGVAAGTIYGYDVLIGAVDVLFDFLLVVVVYFVLAFLLNLYKRQNRRALKDASFLLAFIALAIIIGGPTIYGSVIQIGSSSRINEIGGIQAHTFFPPVYVSTYLNPNTFGGWNSFYSLNLPCCWANYVDFVHYFGLLPLYFATLPFLVQRPFLAKNKTFYFFYLIIGLSLLVSLGTISPLYSLLSRIPYFYSTTITTVLQQQELPIALLAALGFSGLERRINWPLIKSRYRTAIGFPLFIFSFLATWLLILFLSNDQIALEYSQWEELIIFGALSLVVLCLCETLLPSDRQKMRSWRKLVGGGIIILIILLDLFGASYGWVSFTNQTSVYPVTVPIQLIQATSGYSRTVSIGDFAYSLPSDSGQIYQIYDPRGYSSTIPQRYLQFIESVPGFEYTQNKILYQYYSPSSLLNLLGVRYVLSPSTAAVRPPGNASLSFDGADDYVALPPLNNTYALEAWVNGSQFSGNPQMITIPASNASWSSPYFEMTLYSVGQRPVLGLQANGLAHFIANASYLQPNQWYDIVGTYDKNVATLYVNGVSIAHEEVPGDINRFNQSVFVGTGIPSLGAWNGQIGYVRAYDTPLTARQVEHNYEDPSNPITTGLSLNLLLNQSSGSLALDTSGNGANGKIVGATWTNNTQSQLKLILQEGEVRVYENDGAMPRAFLVHSWQASSNETEALNQMIAPGFDLRSAVVLEGGASTGSAVCPGSNRDTTQIASYNPDSVTIETQSNCPGYLILTDSYYNGWQAEIDGSQTPIYPADGAFRGVFVPSGSHTITFAYVPNTYYRLIILSLVSLAIIVGMNAIIVIRRRRSNSCTQVARN